MQRLLSSSAVSVTVWWAKTGSHSTWTMSAALDAVANSPDSTNEGSECTEHPPGVLVVPVQARAVAPPVSAIAPNAEPRSKAIRK